MDGDAVSEDEEEDEPKRDSSGKKRRVEKSDQEPKKGGKRGWKKGKGKKGKGKGGGDDDDDDEEGADSFQVDVSDSRFASLLNSDPRFGIDKSSKFYKDTDGMKAILQETSKRKRNGKRKPAGRK